MRRFCLLLLIFTLTLCARVSAQDAATWPIVERCSGDATEPPDGWTFDGTLIMTSYGRLHAFRQEWATPRILAFYREDIPHSGLLSPDGHWYAVIDGTRWDGEVGIVFSTEAIVVYSTTDDTKYIVPWEGSFGIIRRLYGYGLYWFDNQHLLYQKGENQRGSWFMINPFTQSMERWDSNLNLFQELVVLAPDSKTALYTNWEDGYEWTLSRGEESVRLSLRWGGVWRPDSQAFAAYMEDAETQQADHLALFNLQGNRIDTLFNIPAGVEPFESPPNWYHLDKRLLKWSPDSQFLLFAVDHLYIADIVNRQIFDTCIKVKSYTTAAWSPSSIQLALIERQDRYRRIQIFDLQTWGRYVVWYHSGDVTGWRAD